MKRTKSRGFTLIELLVVIAIIALLVGILLPALGKARKNAQQIKDATQVRGIVQALINWGADNKERFPNPEQLDSANRTLTKGIRKNRTGNIFSLMIWNQSTTPELMISPSEVGSIQVMPNYAYQQPIGAQAPTLAQWDPHYKGSPNDDQTSMGQQGNDPPPPGIGNNSYAHMCIAGARSQFWRATLNASLPLVANRGPVYQNIKTPIFRQGEDWELLGSGGGGSGATDTGVGSDTLFIHGPENIWAGNISYGDGHVGFELTPSPEAVTFVDRQGGGVDPINQPDNIFVDEQNEGTSSQNQNNNRNAILRIWATGIPVNLPFDSTLHLDPESSFVWVDGNPAF